MRLEDIRRASQQSHEASKGPGSWQHCRSQKLSVGENGNALIFRLLTLKMVSLSPAAPTVKGHYTYRKGGLNYINVTLHEIFNYRNTSINFRKWRSQFICLN